MTLVIIPIYNAENYLAECLDSLFAQTYQDFCVACVDDGSNDGSLRILKKYALEHPNLSIIHTDNFGPSHARNLALDTFIDEKIDWVSFLDADDMFEPDYFQQIVDAQTQSNADIVCTSFQFYKSGRKSRFGLMGAETRALSGFEATKELLTDKTIQSHSHCKLYKASLWKGVRFPEQIVAMEDQATIFKTFCKARTVLVDPSINGYLYRQTNGSICSSPITNKRVLDSIEGYMVPCLYNYPMLKREEGRLLLGAAKQSLAECYLMMYPRYQKKLASEEEQIRWKGLNQYIQENDVIRRFSPVSQKDKWKRRCFIYARPFYRFLYRVFSKRS